jgi:hypothetical protein
LFFLLTVATGMIAAVTSCDRNSGDPNKNWSLSQITVQ